MPTLAPPLPSPWTVWRRMSRLERFWAVLATHWLAVIAAAGWPFLHWSHAQLTAAVLHWLTFLPGAATVILLFLWLVQREPDHASDSKNIGYIGRLDHLRFFAAILVVLYHFYHGYVGMNTLTGNPLLDLIGEGSSGVDLFFVLSGFIFGLIGDGKKIRFRDFIFSRVVRIYPLYVFGLLLMVAAHPGPSPLDLLLLLVPVFDVGLMPGLPGYGQSWTIGLEFQFYLFFPLLMGFISRLGYRYLIGLLGLALTLRIFVFLDHHAVRDLAHWSMLGRFDQFALGILSAVLFLRRRTWFSHPLHLFLAALVLIGGMQWLTIWGGYQRGENSPLWIIWCAIEGAIWAYLIVSYLGCRWRLPSALDDSLAHLGRLSFSIYLMQSYPQVWTMKRVGLLSFTADTATNAALTGLLICLPLTVALASLTYYFIERPFFAFRRKYTEPLSA